MIFCKHDLASGKHDLNSFEKFQVSEIAAQSDVLTQVGSQSRTICLVMDCEVSFSSNYFDLLEEAFRDSDLAVLYTDFEYESGLTSVRSRIRPPNWSPERFLSNDFLGPVFAVDMKLLNESLTIGKPTRTQLLLSCISGGLKLMLIEQVGYVVSPRSLNITADERTHEVTRFLTSHRPKSKVTSNKTPWLRISNSELAPNIISVIIPTRGTKKSILSKELIVNCVESLKRQNINNSSIEVIIVFDSDSKLKYLNKLKKLKSENLSISLVTYEPPFNFAKKCNLGAQSASGEVVLFLNDDTLFLDPDVLLEMSGTAMIKDVGAVGAKLLFENGRIQHAGYILREGFVGHAYIKDIDGFGPFGDLVSTHEVVGVTGACLAQRKEIWESVGKWNESFPASYNDVDYCFRITESGLSILQVNQAKLKHFESVTRNPKVYPREREMIEQLWGHKFKSEPFFRMAVTIPEMRAIRGNTLVRYVNYARATFRRQGFLGLWGLLLNVGRKTIGSKAKK